MKARRAVIIAFPVWTRLGTAFSIAGMAYHIARENQQLGQFFGQERRCLHDLIAGTRVVQGQPEAS